MSKIDPGRARSRMTLLLAGFLLTGAADAEAQQDSVVRERPKAKMRSIVLKKLFTIDTKDVNMDGSERLTGITRTSAGKYYLATVTSAVPTDPAITVLSSTGKFIQRLGRRGSGPGEFNDIHWLVAGRGDTIYALDRNRVTSYQGGKLIGTVSLSIPAPRIWSLPGQLITWAIDPNADYRVYDRSGATLAVVKSPTASRSFGPVIVAGAKDVWVADATKYRFERWSPKGKRLGVFVRNVSWFGTPPTEERRYGTLLTAFHVDRAERVWCFFTVLSKSWRPDDEKYDTMVEVIDPRTREVLASRRIEGTDFQLMASDLVVTTRQDKDGFNLFDVMELNLQ